ncbi:hypothetical protein R5R35_002512 [Gryllus longicercus]|uniref:Uncharacterized protein n=1 Tax=Gryllus longicercus TaxID=2509291 RepID=A0AAN9Z5V0_9ORTH
MCAIFPLRTGSSHPLFPRQSAENGKIPCGAVWAGLDKNGDNMYVARARHEQDLLPGKVVPSKGGMFVSYGGQEHSKCAYEVMLGRGAVAWQQCSGGRVPPKAVEAGRTCDGEKLYVGRVVHDGALTPGKVHSSHRKCYIPFDGKEFAYDKYEVLVALDCCCQC